MDINNSRESVRKDTYSTARKHIPRQKMRAKVQVEGRCDLSRNCIYIQITVTNSSMVS